VIFFNVKILFLIILTDNFFLQTRMCDFWYKTQKKKKELCKRKRSFGLGRRGHVEGFQTSTHLRGYLGCLYPTRDVWAFIVAVAIRCREPNQGDSWFHYHAHHRIHSVSFACKIDGKILFYKIIFLIAVLYENF
jgi:hypothetical protein